MTVVLHEKRAAVRETQETPVTDLVRTNKVFLSRDPAPDSSRLAKSEEQNRLKAPPMSPPGRLAREAIVTFADGNALAAFLGGPGQAGIHVVDMIRDWNMVRIRGDSEDALRRFLESVPGLLDQAPNILVALPDESPQVRQPVRTEYVGFGNSALAWLGIRGEHAAWGKGVTIAVLDVGIAQVSGLNEGNIERIDLTGGQGADPAAPVNGHATAVAAIIAGSLPDAPGVSPASHLLSIKVLNDDGTGDAFTLARGIIEAANRGAAIINICISSPSDVPVLRRAVEYALGMGCAVVAASGNDASAGVAYPARYPGVVAVSAVDASGQRLPFAGEGPEVDISAPGLAVKSLWSENTNVNFSGTSAAAPFVSGTLAAILSRASSMSPKEAIDLLLRYSDDVGIPGKDPQFGCGILDVGRVMNRDTRGIYDLAIADNYVSGASTTASVIPVTVSVQNRGTEPVRKGVLKVKAGTREYEMIVANLGVGETIGYQIDVTRDEISGSSGLNIDSLVLLKDAEDAVPGNNFKRTALFVKGTGAAAR